MYLISLLVFILAIGLLIFVHELGHFLSAKLFRVRVEEFGFGFPPRLFGKKKGETLYSVNVIPAGGFVKLAGEDEDSTDPRSISVQPAWVRGIIIVSGVAMNFLLAWLIFTIIYTIGGPIATEKVVVGSVADNSPAKRAGLKEGDLVVEFGGVKAGDPWKLGRTIKDHVGQENTLVYEREGGRYLVKIIPRQNPPEGQGPLGISTLPDVTIKAYPVWEAPIIGTVQSIRWTGEILTALKTIVTDLVAERTPPSDIGGFVRIGYVTHKATLSGFQAVLRFLGLLSLNLALLNILPLPALDGGRLVFVLIEGITKRRVPFKVERWVHGVGMALLIVLTVLVTYNDIIWVWANTSLKEKIQFLLPR